MSGTLRCLVFGGSGALGRVVCETLAGKGARVAFTYHRNEAAAKELLPKLPGGRSRALDLSSVAEIERSVDDAAEAFGGLDAFIQCAGVAITMESKGPTVHHRMGDVDEGGWDRIMDINVKSTYFAVRRVAEILRAGGGGNVVLVGSIDGVKPVPAPVHYAASKAALGGLTQSMAKELGEFKIRVNQVAPGLLDGGISKALPDNLMQEYLKHCGFKRKGRFSEIAEIISWLACHNTYITGQTILADGGL